jgi:hypothetical protein
MQNTNRCQKFRGLVMTKEERFLATLKFGIENPTKIKSCLEKLFKSNHPILQESRGAQLFFAQACFDAIIQRGFSFRKMTFSEEEEKRSNSVLMVLASTTTPMIASQISKETDISISCIHKLLGKMVLCNMISHSPPVRVGKSYAKGYFLVKNDKI